MRNYIVLAGKPEPIACTWLLWLAETIVKLLQCIFLNGCYDVLVADCIESKCFCAHYNDGWLLILVGAQLGWTSLNSDGVEPVFKYQMKNRPDGVAYTLSIQDGSGLVRRFPESRVLEITWFKFKVYCYELFLYS